MKPEYPANGDNAAASNKISTEKINDSKNKDEELDEFSSEFSTKINSFFEIHNSFLYEDVHENASSLEKFLSTDSSSEEMGQMNGNYCDEDEIIDDDKSNSVDSQKIYSSLKRYCLRNVKETPNLLSENGNIEIQSTKISVKNQYSVEIEKKIAIPDSFQLPASNETQNAVTLGAYMFENGMFDIKLPVHNLSNLSQDLTEAQRSVRLNKKSTVKKNFKKVSKEKFVTPCKTEQCFIPQELSFTDVIKKCEIENITPIHGSLKINSSLNVVYGIAENKEQEKELRVVLTDFLDNNQDFKRQLKDKSDVLCLEKALSKLRNKFQNEPKSESKTIVEKNCEKPSEKTLNKSNTKKSSKKDKASSAVVKKKVNKTNDSEKVKDKNFIPDVENQQNSSTCSTNLLEEKLSKKNNLRVSKRLPKKSVSELSSKNKSVSRKKAVPQNNKIMKIKLPKKNTSKKKAALDNKDVFSEKFSIKNTALYDDEIESDLIKDKELVTSENCKQKSKQLFKNETSASVSQNSSVKNLSLNKSANSSGLSGMSQKNSNSFLQLFNKVVESTKSKKVAESNNLITKLFEQRNSSKLQSPNGPSKETDEKLLEEKLHQSNSIKENGKKILLDLKFCKSVEKIMAESAPFEKKQTLQANAEVTSPSEKKNNNKELFKRNVNKSQVKDQSVCKVDFNEYNNTKTTKIAKQQSFEDAVINQLSRKRNNKNKKLKDVHNGLTNSLKDNSTDLCIQEKNKTERKLAESVAVSPSKVSNLSAELYPAATSAIEPVSKRRSRKRKLSTDKSLDSQSSFRSKRKAGSIIKSNSLMPASFSKDPKTIKESKKEPTVSPYKSKRKGKSSHLSDLSHNESSKECNEEYALSYSLSELNSDDKTTRAKRNRRSTSVDPNFYYDIRHSRNKRETTSLSVHKKNGELTVEKKSPKIRKRCKKIDSVNDVSSNAMLEETSVEQLNAIQSFNNGVPFLNDNSNAIPIAGLTPDQYKSFLSSFTILPINPQCKILFNPDSNCIMLAAPITPPGNLPALMPSNPSNDNMSSASHTPFHVQNYPASNFPLSEFISASPYLSSFTSSPNPQVFFTQQQNFEPAVESHSDPSVVCSQNTPSVFAPHNVCSVISPQNVPSIATQNIPSLIPQQNILSNIQPSTISSIVNPQNVSVSSSQILPNNSYFNNSIIRIVPPMLQNTKVVEVSTKTTTIGNSHPYSFAKVNQESLLKPDIDWKLLVKDDIKIDQSIVCGIVEKNCGKKSRDITVKEFCSIPQIVQVLSKEVDDISNIELSPRMEYNFRDSFLNESFVQVLREFVSFYMKIVFSKIQDKSGNDLKVLFFSDVYSKFSLLICLLFGKKQLSEAELLTVNDVMAALSVIGIMYIFQQYQRIKKS